MSEKEDVTAKLFEHLRREAHLPRLGRISDRVELEQLVCTVSVKDEVPLWVSSGFPILGGNQRHIDLTSAIYKTPDLTVIDPELRRIALWNHPRAGYARYSIAVWPAKVSETARAEYWVGIKLYFGAGIEFFENHFTDTMLWKDEWKKSVAPDCQKVK